MPDRDPATQHRQETLDDVLAVGMRFVHRADFRAEAEPETLSEMAVVYERAARAVRRTIALQHQLDQAPSRPQLRAVARRQLIRTAEDAIQQRAPTEADAERLTAELRERLDAPELDDEIGNRPVDEIIADICHDLGLGNVQELHRHKRRTPDDVAELCARASHPPRATAAPSDSVNDPEPFFRIVPSPTGFRGSG